MITAEQCSRCDGCGRIDDGDGAPWSAWLALPLGSAAAVVAGIVKPITCPDCGGSGAARIRFHEVQDGVIERCLRRDHDGPHLVPEAKS